MKEIIINQVDRVFNCNALSTLRKRENVNGRIATSFYLRSVEKLSLKKIGQIINKDHSSVIHYIKQHESLYLYEKEYKSLFDKLTKIENTKQLLCNQCVYERFKFNKRAIPSV
jgi:chromosomal replication initiation ATPase DnaA